MSRGEAVGLAARRRGRPALGPSRSSGHRRTRSLRSLPVAHVNRSGDNRCGPGSAPTAVSLQYREQPRPRALGDHLPVWLVADIGTFSTPPRECFANPDYAPKEGARRGDKVSKHALSLCRITT